MAEKRRTPSRATGPRSRTGPGRSSAGRQRPTAESADLRADRARELKSQDARRPRLTGRAAVLVLVLAVLMVSYASSLRAYLQQRTHIEDLTAKIAERQAGIDDLEREKSRWSDPAYLEQQARRRFGYVMPGERSYIVLDENGNRLEGDSSLIDPSSLPEETPTAWWSTAWESVELAGKPPKVEKPPAATIDGSAESQE